MEIYNDIVKENQIIKKGIDIMDKNLEHEGCCCGVDEEDMDVEVITLEFDDGESVECEVIGVFDFEEKEYIALLPVDGTDDVYIYGYKELDDEEFELIDINDEDEFERVADAFEKLAFEEDEEVEKE